MCSATELNSNKLTLAQAEGLVRRKLAELELEVDRQQGWVRGGTKGQVRGSRSSVAANMACFKLSFSHGIFSVSFPLSPPNHQPLQVWSLMAVPRRGLVVQYLQVAEAAEVVLADTRCAVAVQLSVPMHALKIYLCS